MRVKNSIKNSIFALLCNLVSITISFIARTFFIKILGAELLGLDSLFINIISVLSIFELGVGNAIVFNLYKPIEDNNISKIKSLMNFYKKAYYIIALIIFVIGLIIVPFLKYIVGNLENEINLYLVYTIFLLSSISTYFLSYKRSLIIANQKNYIISVIHMIYLILVNVFQLLFVWITKNYYLYLLIKLVFIILENVIITIIANKMYPFLRDKNVIELDSIVKKDIYTRIKALLFHKIGIVVVLGTDNIIISGILGVIVVGIYSNYYTIINAVDTLFGQIITTSTASVGNLLLENNPKKSFEIFDKMRFLNFWVACFCGSVLLVTLQPFICIWVGKEYIISFAVLAVIIFNFFQKMMRKIYITFKDSAGIWREDKWVPIIEAIINIIFSIILVKLFGLIGVFIGTILSGLIVWCYDYPKFVYKNLFKRAYIQYFKETLGYIASFILISGSLCLIIQLWNINNYYLKFIINLMVATIYSNLTLYLMYHNNINFIYLKKIILRKAGKNNDL